MCQRIACFMTIVTTHYKCITIHYMPLQHIIDEIFRKGFLNHLSWLNRRILINIFQSLIHKESPSTCWIGWVHFATSAVHPLWHCHTTGPGCQTLAHAFGQSGISGTKVCSSLQCPASISKLVGSADKSSETLQKMSQRLVSTWTRVLQMNYISNTFWSNIVGHNKWIESCHSAEQYESMHTHTESVLYVHEPAIKAITVADLD